MQKHAIKSSRPHIQNKNYILILKIDPENPPVLCVNGCFSVFFMAVTENLLPVQVILLKYALTYKV